MAFQTIGMKMVIQGASQLVRDISNVANSVYNFGQSVDRVQSKVIKLAQAQVNQWQKAVNQSTKSIISLTQDQEKYTSQLSRAEIEQKKWNTMLSGYSMLLGTMTPKTTEYANTLIKTAQATAKAETATLDVNEAEKNLKTTQDALKVAQEGSTKAANGLAAAQKKLAESGADVNNMTELLGQVLNAATGGFGKTAVMGGTLGAVVAKLGLQMNAAALILNVFKLGMDSLVFAGKLVMGALQLVWNVFSKIASVALQAGKAVIDWVVKGLKSVIMLPINVAVGALNGLWQSLKRIGEIAIGMNLSNLMWNLGAKIKDLGLMAFNAAADFQSLRIRMTSLLQREMSQATGTSFADNLGKASEKAKELTGWISELAVKSRFTGDAVANVFTLGMSYDLASKDAQELTNSIVNFATGMGLQEDQMRRIIENFGQMKAQGKLTGTEMRDLARGAFVPVNRMLDIMGDSLGMDTTKLAKFKLELQQGVSEGTIDIKGFFDAFTKMSNEDFPDAINKMSISWEVARSNIGDFIKTVIGWRVITPTLDILSERMSTFIQQFMQPDILKFAESLGKVFAFLAETIIKFSDSIIGDILKIDFKNIASGFMKLSDGAKAFIDRLRAGIPANNINNAVHDMREGLKDILGSNLFGTIGERVLTLSKRFLVASENIGKIPIADSVKTFMNILGDTWNLLWNSIFKPKFDESWKKIKDWITNTWNEFVVPNLWKIWNTLVTSIGDFFANDFPAWWDTVGGPNFQKMIDGLTEWANGSDVGQGVGGKIVDKIVEFLQANAGPGSYFVSAIGSVIKSVFQLALAAGLSVLTGGGEAAEGADLSPETSVSANENVTAVQGNVGGLSGAIKGLETAAQKALDGSVGRFSEWAGKSLEPFTKLYDMIKVMSLVIGDIVDPLAKIVDSLIRIAGVVIPGGGAGVEGGAGAVAAILKLATAPLDWIATAVEKIATALEKIGKATGLDKLTAGTEDAGFIGGFAGSISLAIDEISKLFKKVVDNALESKDNILLTFTMLKNDLVTYSIIPDMLNAILLEFQTKLGQVVEFLTGTFIPKAQEVFSGDAWFLMGSTAMTKLLEGLRSLEGPILDWFDSFKSQFHINITIGVSTPNNADITTPKTSPTGEVDPHQWQGSKGGHFIVPKGFDKDNYNIGVSTGEEVIVIPRPSHLNSLRSNHFNAPISNSWVNRGGATTNNNRTVNNYLTVNTSKTTTEVTSNFRNMGFLGE